MVIINKDVNSHFIKEGLILYPGKNEISQEQEVLLKDSKWFNHLLKEGVVIAEELRKAEEAVPSADIKGDEDAPKSDRKGIRKR